MGFKANPSKYTDKYGSVDTAKWQQDINAMGNSDNGFAKFAQRLSQKNFDKWKAENKYKQQTINQQIMSGAARTDNVANTSTNEIDTTGTDNQDVGITSVGKKKKTQGSLSTSLGL